MVAAICIGIITVAQFAVTATFLFKSRKINEITWLPKVMMVMALLSSAYYCVGYSLLYFEKYPPELSFVSGTMKIMVLVNYGLLFRFARLQV